MIQLKKTHNVAERGGEGGVEERGVRERDGRSLHVGELIKFIHTVRTTGARRLAAGEGT